MALPELADQKREQERKALKTLLTRTLLASLGFHALLLVLNLKPLWTATVPEPEEIAIVVTEDEEPEIEEPVEEPTEELLTGDSGGEPVPGETVALAEPIQPFIPPPVPTPEPAAEPTPQPVVEPSPLLSQPADANEEPIVPPSPTPPSPTAATEEAPQTAVAPTPQRNIRDLLEQLRRDRASQQQTSPATSSPTAVGTPSSPLGGNSDSDSRSGSGDASGSGSSSGSGNNTGTERRREPEAPPASGEGRRIACRNCPDVDYPEEALRAGQEGTVKVMVDYDENGNVVSATLVNSSGHTVLDEAVLETVREKYRLDDTGGAGSTVLSVDMTIDGSDFNRQARERGDRRAVDIPPPPVAEEPAPANTAAEPITEPEPLVESSTDTATPALPAETPQEATNPTTPAPITPANEPDAAPAPQPDVAPTDTAPPAAESEPAYVEPEPLPEPAYVPPPEPVYEEPAYVEPAYEEPAYEEPTSVEPPAYEAPTESLLDPLPLPQ